MKNKNSPRTVAQIASDATKELELVQKYQEEIIKDTESQIAMLLSIQATAVKECSAAKKAIKRLLKLFGF